MPTAAASVLARALDPEIGTGDDAASERILDAALELAAASGLRNLTMDDVARRARLGRMTVYRRFGGRDQLVEALTVRECRRCLAQILAAIGPVADAESRVAEGFLATLRVAREHPLLRRIADHEPEVLLAELRDPGSPVLALLRDFLVAQAREGQEAGELLPGDPALAAELLVRLGASFVLMPHGAIALDDDETVRELARTSIAPMLVPRRA